MGERADKLRAALARFLRSLGVRGDRAVPWAALIPRVTNTAWRNRRCAGENWLLLGDAAGHADALTGEGLCYALRGAMLAAEAIAQGKPEEFEQRWRDEFGSVLAASAHLFLLAEAKRGPLGHAELIREAYQQL